MNTLLKNISMYTALTVAPFFYVQETYGREAETQPKGKAYLHLSKQELQACHQNKVCQEYMQEPESREHAEADAKPSEEKGQAPPLPVRTDDRTAEDHSASEIPNPLEGVPGYLLRARIVNTAPTESNASTESRITDAPSVSQFPSVPNASGANVTNTNASTDTSTSSRSLEKVISRFALGISEGFEQINGKYGLSTRVDLTLKIDDWIAFRTGIQVSYATTALSQTKTTADQGRTQLGKHLVDRWSYSRTDSESYRNALAFSAAVILGSLDRETFGVEDLDAYLALGGKVRLVEGIQQRTEQRTSQLLYRGEPRDKLQSPVQVTADSTLLPLLIPTAGLGVCYGIFDSAADICAEFGAGLRVKNPDKPGEARLETDGDVGIKFGF